MTAPLYRFSPAKCRALRRRKGLAAEQVAADALRSVTWVEEIESGNRVPSADDLFALMYALDCTPLDLAAVASVRTPAAGWGGR